MAHVFRYPQGVLSAGVLWRADHTFVCNGFSIVLLGCHGTLGIFLKLLMPPFPPPHNKADKSPHNMAAERGSEWEELGTVCDRQQPLNKNVRFYYCHCCPSRCLLSSMTDAVLPVLPKEFMSKVPSFIGK